MEDRLHMYDSLLDQDPDVQARVARAKIEGQQQAVIDIVEIRFPALLEEAQQKVIRLNVSDQLSLFLKQMVTVSDETTARWLLSTLAA